METFFLDLITHIADTNLGGPPGGGSFTAGGTQAVSITAQPGSKYQINLTVMCPNPTDYISCIGTIFQQDGNVLSVYTTQGPCVANIYSNIFTSQNNSCDLGTTYNLNLVCINQTVYSPTQYVSGQAASFMCLP